MPQPSRDLEVLDLAEACISDEWGATCRALEPVISGQIMELHHSKHHNTYVTALNKAAEAYSAVRPLQLHLCPVAFPVMTSK